MTRHEAVAASDTSGVNTQPTKPKQPLVVKLILAAIAATIAVMVIMAGVNSSHDDDRSGTSGYLCDLLRSGHTTGELASNDVWQTWTDGQSALARGMEITAAADRGGCLNLT